jgi:lysozyme
MKINKAGLVLIKEFESLHDGDLKQIGLQPKMCPALIWTVGYGRALTDPATGKFLKGAKDKAKAYAMYPKLTEAEAVQMLLEDTSNFSRQVKNLLGKTVLTDNQFSALVSFSYNLGAAAFGKSTLRKKLLVNPNDPSIKDEFGKWVKAGGVVLKGLVRRRDAEAALYFSK